MAATVSKPRGWVEAFLWTNLRACLKLQNVSGNSGYIKSTFIIASKKNLTDSVLEWVAVQEQASLRRRQSKENLIHHAFIYQQSFTPPATAFLIKN
jgi:hypothetical protein